MVDCRTSRERGEEMTEPYVYIASSWRNPYVLDTWNMLQAVGIEAYNFKDAEGFHWSDIDPKYEGVGGPDSRVNTSEYKRMLKSPVARKGFARDMEALERATHLVLVLPCGKSAHLEAGWAVGQDLNVACMTMGNLQPELMYSMFDTIIEDPPDLLEWMGCSTMDIFQATVDVLGSRGDPS